jgi:hypothetical protein
MAWRRVSNQLSVTLEAPWSLSQAASPLMFGLN